MRDKSHAEQVERWAEYCRTHSDWKQKLNRFINAQFELSRRFYKKLAETEEGREKIKELRNLK